MAHKNKSNWSPYKARQKNQNLADSKASESISHFQSSYQLIKKSATNQLRGQHRRSTETFSLNEVNDRLFDVFRNHGFEDFPHSLRMKLAEFYTLLMEQQNKENFTRILNVKDAGLKHFIDSLIVTKFTNLKFPLMDVGTGPGFPGIPLKIYFPNEQILLAEGVQKRVEFLKTVREKLELEKLLILGRNINEECFYPVQGVITRAVEDMRNTLGNVINTLQLGGQVYFMKGPNVDPEIPMALDAWGEFYKLKLDQAYVLPNSPHERRLIVFEKIKTRLVSDEFLEDLGLTEEFED